MTEAVIRKKPGMVSVKEMPVLQDGPPPGGFLPVRYARRIPTKGPSAVAIFLTAFGVFSYGMYEVGKGNKIRRALKEEKYAARRAIIPILQAEEDERFVKEWNKYLEEEARIMKDVPGWKVGESVYNSGRWVPPASGELRPDIWSPLMGWPNSQCCSVIPGRRSVAFSGRRRLWDREDNASAVHPSDSATHQRRGFALSVLVCRMAEYPTHDDESWHLDIRFPIRFILNLK